MNKKLICTLNITKPDDIITLFNNGVQVIRINFSHIKEIEDYNKLEEIIKIFEELKRKNPERVCYLAYDTHGPEIRSVNSIEFEKDEKIIFSTGDNLKNDNKSKICILSISKFNEDLKVNEFITIGNNMFQIIEIQLHFIVTLAKNKGKIEKNKSVSIPRYFDNWNLNTHKYLSLEDKKVLKNAEKNKIEIIFLSFIQNEYQINEVKLYLNLLNTNYKPTIISKIEDRIGVENFLKIQDVSDGIMIARGDLYQNIGIENSFSSYLYLVSLKPETDPSKILILATGTCDSLSEYSKTDQILKKSEVTEIGIAATNKLIDSLMFDETATGNIENILFNVKSVIIDGEKFLYSCCGNIDNEDLCMCEIKPCKSSKPKSDQFFTFLNYKKICPSRLNFYNKKLKDYNQLPSYLPYCIEIKEINSKKEIKCIETHSIVYLVKTSSQFVMKGSIYFLK